MHLTLCRNAYNYERMENAHIITEIEHSASAAGLSIAEVCRRAGVANSTFTRWKAGVTSPNYRSIESIRSAIRDAMNGANP